MDIESIKEQIQEKKKLLYLLGATLIFGAYMLWPAGEAEESSPEGDALSAELAALQANRENTVVQPTFSGTDRRGISLGGGGDAGEDRGAFETDRPAITGTFVGWGTRSDFKGEYLVAFIVVEGNRGVKADMREISGYSTNRPTNIAEGDGVRVYGDWLEDDLIRARAIQ